MSSGADKSVHLDEARALVCMEAAWEIDALAALLAGQTVDPDSVDVMQHLLVLRGVCCRVRRLSSVLMSAIGEADLPTERLERVVHEGSA